jgi:hypothetical protein
MAAAAACISTLFVPGTADAAALTALTLTPSNPTKATSNTLTYAISSSSGAAQCIRVHFSSSTTFSGTLPTGMSFATPVLTGNATGYTTTSTSDYVQGTNAAGPTLTGITITNVTNPSSAGSLYSYIEVFSAVGCTGLIDTGTVATAITDNTTVSVTVDPSFTFTVANQATACNGESNFVTGAGTATTVALGSMAVSSNKSGGQLLTVSSNAGAGYSVYVRGTQASGQLRAGATQWSETGVGTFPTGAALTAGEKFGFTFNDANATGSVVNPASGFFSKLDNATTNKILDGSGVTPSGTGCISFDAQTGASTPAGTYTATIIYTAVPVF